MIEEPVNAAPHSISSGPGRIAGLNHSGPSLAVIARLANAAEEAASINRPGNLNPDADAVEASPTEEAGAESESRPSDDPDRLALTLSGSKRLKLAAPLLMTLIRMEARWRWQLALQPPGYNSDATASSSEEESVDDAPPASPFSYAELEDKLKQITPDWKAIKPSTQMFDMMETLMRGLRSLAQQHKLFTQMLQTVDYMKTFASRRQEIENQLRLSLERAEASASTLREENEALRVELAEVKSKKNQLGRLHEAEGEAARLRDEVNQLRTEVSNEKKQKEDLQLRLDAQKEELEREFAVEREELAAEYQQQVDDTFIFGYRCCMKNNGIKRDTPSIPPGEEKKLQEKPAPQ
ncbi:hypothetical protein AAG906_007973 [Vitis piasezkii]